MKTNTVEVLTAYTDFCAKRSSSVEALLSEARSLAEMMDMALALETNAGIGGDLIDLRTMLVVDIAELEGDLARLQRQRGRRVSGDECGPG